MELEKFYQSISEIKIELTKLSTRLEKLDDFTRRQDEISRRVDDVEKGVSKALESTKSAHHRLNQIHKICYWLLTAVGGAVIVFIVGYAMKGGFYKP